MNRIAAADLGARLKAGDEDVLEELLRMHGPPVLALLRRRLAGRLTETDFEDVLATALFRLWTHRERFDAEKASLRVWFFRIAENVARDVLKHGWHKARQLERPISSDVLDSVEQALAAGGAEPDARLEQDARRPSAAAGVLSVTAELLHELLGLLPEIQRRIVLADARSRDGTAASHDLALELGIPAATIRVYRRRALQRLRLEFQRRGVTGS